MASGKDSAGNSAQAVATLPPPGGEAPDGPANPAGLTGAQLAKLLGMDAERVRQHLADGAPVAADGRVNLVHYAAWLNSQLAAMERTDGD